MPICTSLNGMTGSHGMTQTEPVSISATADDFGGWLQQNPPTRSLVENEGTWSTLANITANP